MQKIRMLIRHWDRFLPWLQSIPALLTRITVGFGFYLTGQGKLANIGNVISYFNELHIPMAQYQAPFVARLEYYGAMLLIMGLFTRPVAFLLSGTMAVALLTADKADFIASWSKESEKVPTEITAYAYLLLLTWLFVTGAGLLSLDALLSKLLGLRKAPEADSAKS
jgi:putative oxidoreductase